jgi:hypothetical protein
VQPVKIGAALFVLADRFAIEYRIAFQPCRFLHDARMAFGPSAAFIV